MCDILTGPTLINFQSIHLVLCMREGERLDEQYNVCANQQKSVKVRKIKRSRVMDALERMK